MIGFFHCVFHFHVLIIFLKKLLLFLKHVLKAEKGISFIKSQLLTNIFLIFYVMKWEIHLKHFSCILKCEVDIEQKWDHLNCELNRPCILWNTVFIWNKYWQTNPVAQSGTLERYFHKNEWSESFTLGRN